jgi:predicted Co/Zn/Cd cation transporter (cation efflux family)
MKQPTLYLLAILGYAVGLTTVIGQMVEEGGRGRHIHEQWVQVIGGAVAIVCAIMALIASRRGRAVEKV